MGIDLFRLAAAFLVIAIHTSPLASFGETGDFILTRILARTAVPFFFMVSGYFTISRYACDTGRLKGFLKRTAQIYGIAMLLYLPINLYNGYFQMEFFLPNLIRDVLLDGTMYHLWYLPASMEGALIAWYLLRHLDETKALGISFVLYLIGMFGDSYYGVSELFSASKGFYRLIFQVMDHTRNGIFFAPVFFLLGSLIAEQRKELPLKKSVPAFTISLILMLCEGMLLHRSGWQRFDSMYLMLLPCMFFLFQILLHWKKNRCRPLRTITLLIYLIHPLMITVIHFLAGLFHFEDPLLSNSMIHYLAVCLLSVLFAVPAGIVLDRRKNSRKKGSGTGSDCSRAWIEVNPDHLRNNVRELKKLMPPKCELMAVVKAEAYGHGASAVSVCLERMGVRAFAVATIDEAIQLRREGIRGELLILGYTDPARARELKKYDLMQTIASVEHAAAFNRQKIRLKVHVKIDTGMNRLGIPWSEFPKITRVFQMKNLSVCGLYTHLSCSDSRKEEDRLFTETQIERFYQTVDKLKEYGIAVPKLHLQSSYGLLNYPGLRCDYARVGIALYGAASAPGDVTKQSPSLQPVLSLKAKVVCIRSLKKGESFGYGRAFTAERDSRIALLPVGYADGYPRTLSCGKAYAQIRGRLVPVIGKICMDQLAVDITEADFVSAGDTAVLIGGTKELSAPVVAAACQSISNELLCRLGRRLPVVLKE